MSSNNQFTSNFRESSLENNVDLGTKFVTKSYLMDVYPYLTGMGNIQFPGLWLCGYNAFGQLGDNTIVSKSSPIQTIAFGTNWKQISNASNFVSAIKTDGTLWLWGYNDVGQLGNNTSGVGTDKSSPVQTIALGTNWKHVSCSYSSALAIKTDGTLWTWGNNSFGQLGDSTQTNRSSPVQTISFGTNWKQVSCGGLATAAIKTDGTLWTWGWNNYGNLGDSTQTNTSSPVQTTAGGTNWKQVSCTTYHSGAIKTDGTLWTWGWNAFGSLGDSTQTDRSSPVQTIAGGTNWKQISCGGLSTTAIKTDGTLWAWGYNWYGQLGDGTGDSNTDKSIPVQTIAGGTNWKKVSTCSNNTAAIKTDGTLWTWGNNTNGQLGNGTNSTKTSSPAQTIAGGTNWKEVSSGTDILVAIKEMGDDF
jgi:alpha-tubulin suppressor-like RCC1 family protein